MTTLREETGPGAEGGGPDPAATGPASVPAWRRALTRLVRLVRQHWIFASALAAAALPRLAALLGFQPAVLFQLDTYDYLWGAVHVSPNVVNPSGYSLFLWLLRPFHSIVLVVLLQHLLGLGVATMVYALARRYGVPGWGATLAAAPVLFLPLVLLVPLFLLLRRVGWRTAGASLLAGVIPVVGYMGWFADVHGSFNLTNSNGLFLWSRTMSFSNCAVIKPPADLQALCPGAQPGRLAETDPSQRLTPRYYLWNHRTWQWRGEPTGFVPDTAAFTQANNGRALRFAIMAIEAQPFSYVSVIATAGAKPFVSTTNNLRFPAVQPHSSGAASGLVQANQRYEVASIRDYLGSAEGVAGDLGNGYGTRLESPYSSLMNSYQRIVFLPGQVLALIMLTGLAGLILPRRRTAAAALLWASAAILIVLPIAEHEYTYRYVLPAVPLACIAAAIALRKPGHEAVQAQAAAVRG